MSESTMRGRVVRALKDLNAIAVENPVLPGTPDVNYVEGWIELKWLREWPADESTPVRFPHFTPVQRVWHIRRRLAGGMSWVLVQCKREWLLFDGAIAALYLNQSTKAELWEVADVITDTLNPKELAAWISRKQSAFLLTVEDEEKLRQVLRSGIRFPSPST